MAEADFSKLTVLLELLAVNQIPFEKESVRGDILKVLRERGVELAPKSPDDRLRALQHINLSLVATGYLGEKTAESRLAFLNLLNDSTLARILSEQPLEVQAAVIVSLSESRAASTLAKLGPEIRKSILERMSSGEAVDVELLKTSFEELVQSATVEAQAPLQLVGGDDGALAVSKILTKLSFESQFEMAPSLLQLEDRTQKMILSRYFHVALLPHTGTSFLSRIFVDQDIQWVRSVLGGFGPEFSERVKALLPPMQQRMLEGGEAPNPGDVQAALRGLNERISSELTQGKLVASEIYDLGGNGSTANAAA